MIISFHKLFDKQFKRLASPQKERVKSALLTFKQDPFHPTLRNHPLKGEWSRYRSISAGGDLRMHYRETGESEVLFVIVGTHSQLYK